MENKKKYVSFSAAISITLTALVSGFSLSFLNDALAEEIEANQIKATMEAISIVIPDVTEVEGPIEAEDISFYKGLNASGQVVGYAVKTFDVGYSGDVNILIGYDKTLEFITAIVPLDHTETPNIGSKISDDEFKNQFNNAQVFLDFIVVKKDGDIKSGEINAITGATISSRTVANAVNKAGVYIKNIEE